MRSQELPHCLASLGLLRRRHFLPPGSRVEGGHFGACFCRVRTKILLKDLSVMADDEAHDTALAVARGIGDHREARNHPAVDDVAVCAAGRVLALSCEDLEPVSAIRLT